MEIRTRRLTLRRFRTEDAEDLYAYLSDPEVVKYEPYHPFDRKGCALEAQSRAENPAFIAVELDGRVIGNLYLGREDEHTCEIGWVFARAYWGRGYAAEAARALIGQAFAEGAHRVIAMCDPENAASWRLCERLGMRREAHFRQNVYFFCDEMGKPMWKDTYVYAVLAQEWK